MASVLTTRLNGSSSDVRRMSLAAKETAKAASRMGGPRALDPALTRIDAHELGAPLEGNMPASAPFPHPMSSTLVPAGNEPAQGKGGRADVVRTASWPFVGVAPLDILRVTRHTRHPEEV